MGHTARVEAAAAGIMGGVFMIQRIASLKALPDYICCRLYSMTESASCMMSKRTSPCLGIRRSGMKRDYFSLYNWTKAGRASTGRRTSTSRATRFMSMARSAGSKRVNGAIESGFSCFLSPVIQPSFTIYQHIALNLLHALVFSVFLAFSFLVRMLASSSIL